MSKLLKQYVGGAFRDCVLSGNSAAVCMLDEWLTETARMDITRVNKRSETAVAVREGEA